jgi:hypothetical protein
MGTGTLAASMSGVLPSLFLASISAPFSTRSCTIES